MEWDTNWFQYFTQIEKVYLQQLSALHAGLAAAQAGQVEVIDWAFWFTRLLLIVNSGFLEMLGSIFWPIGACKKRKVRTSTVFADLCQLVKQYSTITRQIEIWQSSLQSWRVVGRESKSHKDSIQNSPGFFVQVEHVDEAKIWMLGFRVYLAAWNMSNWFKIAVVMDKAEKFYLLQRFSIFADGRYVSLLVPSLKIWPDTYSGGSSASMSALIEECLLI